RSLATRRTTLLLAGLLSLACLTSCVTAPSVVAPSGPAAESIANLWWTLLAVGMAVYVAVMGFLYYALFRRRKGDLDLRTPAPRSRMQVVVWAGIIVPALILLGVHGLTLG